MVREDESQPVEQQQDGKEQTAEPKDSREAAAARPVKRYRRDELDKEEQKILISEDGDEE